MDGAMNHPSKVFDTKQDNMIDLAKLDKERSCGGKCPGESIIRQAPFMIVTVNGAGAIDSVNDAAQTILESHRGDLLGRPAGEAIHMVRPEKWAEISSRLAEAGHWEGEVPIDIKSGSTVVLDLAVQRITTGDDPAAYLDVYIGRDITARKKRERDICFHEKSATRAEMAGEVSHELNNYLSIAMGNLELLGMNIERGKFDNLAGRISSVREGMTRIAKFVEGLMAIQKPDTEREIININQFIEDEVFYYRSRPQFRGIEFVCKTASGIPPVDGDRCRLQQAVFNIIQNSADALAAGHVAEKKITISTSFSTEDNTVKIAIADNGPGMGADDYPRLFRQFFSTKGPGHGFGLLAVKGAARSFGGKVSAGPGAGGGACFTLALPVQSQVPKGKPSIVPA
jgi:PAS domain S-box-containing protein